MVFTACSSTPKQGYSTSFDSKLNQSIHHYCQELKCVHAECFGENVTENCSFEGDLNLKQKLFANQQFIQLEMNQVSNLWQKHCVPPSLDTNIICNESETKIEKPKNLEVEYSHEETLTRYENGKRKTVYQQVFILKR